MKSSRGIARSHCSGTREKREIESVLSGLVMFDCPPHTRTLYSNVMTSAPSSEAIIERRPSPAMTSNTCHSDAYGGEAYVASAPQ